MFVDRVLVTPAHLRHDLPHSALAVLSGVDRSAVSAAIRQVRPLLASRGFAVPDQPVIRLRTIEDAFAYAEAEDVELCIGGTDVRVVEHANAEHKQWRPMQRCTGCREDLAEIQAAIAGLVSDRSARRAVRLKASKELVLAADARPTFC